MKSKGERTREHLIQMGIELASLKGLSGFSVQDICTRAGLSKGGFFAHFGEKFDFQEAILRELGSRFYAHVYVEPGELNPVEQLRQIKNNWKTWLEQPFLPGGCFFNDSIFSTNQLEGKLSELVVSLVESWVSVLEEVVAAAMGIEACNEESRRLAKTLHAAIVGYYMVSKQLEPDRGLIHDGVDRLFEDLLRAWSL